MPERYLTVAECADELRVTRPVILKLLRQHRLAGIEIAPGQFRILDPAPKLREHLTTEPLERFPFITLREAAALLKMSKDGLRWHARVGKVKSVKIDGEHCFTVKELRRLAFLVEKPRGRRALSYSRKIVAWLKAQLEEDTAGTAAEIQKMLDKLVQLPEPRRAQAIVEFWVLVERLNALLRE